MASGLNKAKRRIASIRSTQKITKAMEMVATVKLKRFKDFHFANVDYLQALEDAMGAIFAFEPEQRSHYGVANSEAEGDLVLFITSDLGLCGAYNSNLFRFLSSSINKEKDVIYPLGQKGASHLLHEGGYRLLEEGVLSLSLNSSPREIASECQKLRDLFNQRKFKRIRVIYTSYVNSLSFVPKEYVLLPVSIPYKQREEETYCPPLFEPSPKEQIHALMGIYLASVVSALVGESQLSEQASRRNAMDSANDNAEDLLKQLSVEYNKARQASITQEITEVVAGASNAK